MKQILENLDFYEIRLIIRPVLKMYSLPFDNVERLIQIHLPNSFGALKTAVLKFKILDKIRKAKNMNFCHIKEIKNITDKS